MSRLDGSDIRYIVLIVCITTMAIVGMVLDS